MQLEAFNQLTPSQRKALLFDCCHCQKWANTLAAQAPFNSLRALIEQGQTLFSQMGEAEILEAFKGHAKIGDIELLKSKYAGKAMNEQGQVMAASEQTIQQLWALNTQYEAQNGFIFIVCATGKSASEMLHLLKQRINNDRQTELNNGAAEQNKITAIRLNNLIHSEG